MSQLMKKRFPSITSIDVQSDGNTSFLRAARNGQLDKVLEHLKSNIDINTSNANGLNALHLASKDGHVEIVEELLKRGAVVDAATKKGNTALHIASLAGQEEVVKLLVQHGASVNVQSQNGFTPLYMAAQENHDNVVKYLLSNGANQSLSTEDGFTPLAVAMQQGHDKVVTVLLENDTRGKIRLPALHIAAKKDDVKAAKLLLENEHNPDVTSKSGFTPLHIASHYGNQQIANLLIQKGADVNYSAKHNITPLHVASKWGKANMVALLLEHGATIEAKTRDGLTPLHCAARSGHEQVVDMLLERGAPISSKTKNGLAPLHMAAQGDHVDAARILLYHRAPVDEVTVDYLTALHVAAHCGHVRVAKLLLDRQADANARALNGFTPLHIACKKNRIKVVELLLKHGASIGATTESGLTPLHVASFMGCMNIVIYLLQHDANPDVPTVRGETPLHLAARANQTDIIRILLRNGAQVDARAREQQTPLHIASRLGNVDIVMLLLQHGAKVDNATKDMYTALHIASKEGQDEVAAVLLDNGASLDATTKKGFTPLHLAAKYGHLKVAKLLLQKEAPVDAQGKNGVTPLHVASHYDHQSVALLLLDKGASPHATAKNGHTPLHIAARKNQMDIANTLLEYGAQPNAESKAGFTPLHLSSQEGHGEMSALLVEHKADPNHEAKNGLTPLHLCAQEDRVPVAEVLVKNGAEVNAATQGGYTPLHIASHYGQTNMVKFLLQNGANVESTTSLNYTPLHQAAQQGHANIVNILLENNADPNAVTTSGQTPLNIAQKLGYITVIETLKVVTTVTTITTTTTTNIEEKYKVQAPELMHETFMSDSEEEGGEDTVLGDQTYRYLTADEMKSLGDDSLPIDVTRDERIDSNRMVSSGDSNILPPQHIEDSISPEHVTQNYVEYIKKYSSDNIDIARHPINIGFLVSFLVDARGGAMRGCRHSGVRVIVPPRCAPSPTRITCRYVRPQRTPHPPPLMEGEALASRVLELGPVGAKFLGPVIIEVPHFAALRGKEREIVILRSDNGESWKEHTVESSEEILNEVLHDSFEAEDLNQLEDVSSGRITRILTQDFPQYFAVVSRVRQEVHAIGPEGGMVSSTVVPQVQAVFPEGALTKKIKVGLQAQPIDPELTAKLLGHSVAVSPVVTVEPRRRKFHKAITLSMPAPRAHSQGMINQYSGSAPTLRLLCSITGGTTRAQWEDVTGSTPLTFVNDCVSFTTTVSARFWLMDCRNIGDATKMATELYKEAIHVPFMAKFVVFAKRVDPLEARLRVFCMTDDKEDKTLEHQEHFTEVAKSRDVEVLEGKQQYVEFAGNLVPITKSGEQLSFSFRAFRENRLPFSVRVKDQHAEAVSRCLFMKEPKVPKGEPPQQPICILNIVLPDDIVTDTISLTDTDSLRKYTFLSENFDYYRPDPRLADMSNLLGEDWVPLANQLGLTTSEINVIKSEYPDSVAKQAQSMLRMWLSQSGNKSQTNTLENALRRIGREDIIPQCLNVDHAGPTITRIKHEEIGTYRLKKDIDSIDNDAVSDEVGQRVRADRQEAKVKLEFFDKYSAEEKEIEKSEEEDEETFDKPVAERREQIQKRLSAERTIPASSQRREIVQEITTIKEQNLVEDKIAEVQQKVKTTDEQTKTITTKTVSIDDKTVTPETKTVSRTIEIKTTIPSDSKVLETVSHKESQEPKSTTVTETRTFISDISHKTAGDSELLEGVTQSFDKKKIMPKLIAEEDPKSPKFSKTPPPSPADFILRERAATVQEWEAPRQQLDLEPEAPPLEKDATQKGKTTVFHTEEKPFYQNITDRSFVNPKPIYDLTNALIQSESRAEPYHCHTEKHYKINKYADEKQESQSALSKDKKRKKSILGTIKTFVGKSFESDSDSEKSLKKEKKKEKKKMKVPLDEVPPEIPIRPTRKPKLPTPTEDRKYADIPFFESSPTDILEYRSTESDNVEQISVLPPQLTYVSSITIPIADLDDSASGKPRNLREQAEHIVTDVISNGEKAVKENLAEKIATKPKKQKVVIVNEQVTKTFSPMSVEEEEFTITIDPTKKETPKKTRETFTLNIDESIGKIEKEILGKSPILPEENLVKPIAQFSDKPLRSPIFDNLLNQETSQPQISLQPDQFVSQREKWQTCPDLKTITNNLIQNEITFSGWADDKYNLFNTSKIEHGRTKTEESEEKLEDEQKEKMRKKHGKLFSIFSTTTRNESDNISRKKELDKQYSETMKEGPIDPQIVDSASEIKPTKDIPKTPKLKKSKSREKEEKGFLGLLKKGKPEMRPAFSETVIKNMIDSTAFLKEEINKYHDVKMTSDISENYDAMLIYGKEKKTKNYDTLGNGLGHHDIQFIVKEENVNDQKHESESQSLFVTPEDENDVSRKTVQSTERDQERSDFEHFPSVEESKSVPPQKLKNTEAKNVIALGQSEEKSLGENDKQISTESMKKCESFLEEEVARFHDVRPIVTKAPPLIQEKLTTTIVSETETPKKTKGKHGDEKKGTFFDIFRKKGSVEKDVKLKSSDAESLLPSAITETLKKDSDVFLKNEVEKYHDVRPIVTNERTIIQSEIPSKAESKLVLLQKLEDTETKKVTALDQSKKKSLGENEKQKSIESSKEHTGPRSVQISNKDCDSFLKEEIARFHDVRPIVTQQPTLIQEKLTTTIVSETKSPKKSKGKHGDEKKGTFFDIFRKKGSEEKDVKVKSSEAESLLPSAITETLKKDSDVFLKNEVEKYHDVRPIVTNERTIIQSEIPSKAESKLLSPQKLEDTETKKVIALDQSKKKSLGENEKETSIESSKEHTGPGCEQISNKECDSFLKEEVARFHDVRPIVTKEPTLIQEKLTTTIVSETKSPRKSKGKHGDEKKGSFLDIFRKKGSEEKDVKLKSSEAESLVPSSITVTSMIDSDAFLKNEVETYHDVRPIIQIEIPSIAESKSVVPRKIEEIEGNKSTPLDQSKEKNSVEKEEHQPIKNSIKQTHEIHVCEPDTEEPMKTNIFDERQGEPSRIVTTTVTKETLPEGERIMRVNTEVITGTIQIESETLEDFSKLEEQISIKLNEIRKKLPETSDSVVEELDQEIKHEKNEEKPCSVSMNPKIQLSSSETPKTEVAPVSKERIKITEKHFVKEGGYLNETYEVGVEGVSGIQNQRRERGDNSLHDSENFLNRELDKYEGSYSELVKQKVENVKNKEIQPKLSAAALGNMITSSNFLREEVAKYHDVRPRVSNVESETKAKEKGSKFFGFFSKKKSKDKSGQSEYIESKKEGKKPKKGKSEKKAKDHSLKESDSKDFYEGEIDRCQKGEKIKDDVKEEGGSFFGLFSKKTKPQSEAKNAEKETIQSMSQALKEIQDSSEFLHMEVTAYHDVHPESKEVQGSTSNPEVDHKSPTVLSEIFQDTADKQIDDKVTTQKTFSDEHFQSEESSPTRVVTTTVTKKSIPKGERVSKVTTEVITGTIQLDPSVLSDLSKLEDEINSKLDKIRAEMSDNTRETCDDGKESELIHKYHQSFADSTKKTSETHDIIITDGNEQNSQAIGSVFQETHDKKQISEIPDTPLFGKFSEHVSSTDYMKLSLDEEAVKVINTTDDFLMSELKNYEDGDLEPRKDSDSNPKKKSSGIFGMFSKKEKSESPKVTDRKPEKQKSESCADGSRKLGFIEKVGEKIQVFPSSGKKRVFEVTDSHYSEGWDKGMDGTFQDISSNLDVKTTNISTPEPAHYEKGYVQLEGTISETISETKQKVSDAAEHEMEKNTNQENIENRDHVEVKNEPLSFVDDLLHSFDVKIDTTKNEFLDYTNLLNTPGEDTVKSLVSRTEKISTTDSDFLKETKESTAEEIASFEQTITEKFSNTMKLTEEFTTKSKRILEPMSSVDSERRYSENCEMTENKARKQVFDTHDTISTGKSGGEKRVEHHIKLRVATTIQNVEDSAKIAQDKISKDTSGINKKGKSKKEFPVMGDKGDIVGATRDQRKGAVKKLPAGGKKTSYETEYHRQQMTHIKPSVTDSADISEKSTKKSESSLKKSERKISDKTDDLKKEIESEPLYVEKSIKNIVPTVDDNMEKHESLMKKFEYMTRDSPMKQKTIDFLESENLGENFKMTRATSDYGGEVKRNNELSTNISEANIDLSNLPRNTDDIPECPTSSYVTSPYSTRRTLSTRFPKGERPEVIEITYDSTLESSSEDSYIVTEPDETVIKTSTRSPLFHMESEEDSSSEVHEITKERQDSVKSNILEILTENKLECLLTDLTENFKETDKPVGTKYTNQEKLLEEHKKESQADVELIERKLRDLDKALDSLEKVNLGIETDIRNDLIKEKKLRRVERKFEKMASEVIEKEAEGGKDVQMTSPEIEEKRETEYRTLVSQLSTEEISDFQKEYNHLWDENTFSKSSDWESKTPDSQIDAQELPQGSDEATSGATSKESTASTMKTEGEEGAEKDEAGYESKVADQHQLSEEMKALLKELEKESKQ